MTISKPRNLYKKYLFLIEIDGIAHAGFQSCSGLTMESETIEYHEGGMNRPVAKDAGKVKFEPLTLKRGATDDTDTYTWALLANEAVTGLGAPEPTYKRNISIVQKDRSGVILKRWNLTNAWVKKFTAADWDANANEAVIEELVIEYDYFVQAE